MTKIDSHLVIDVFEPKSQAVVSDMLYRLNVPDWAGLLRGNSAAEIKTLVSIRTLIQNPRNVSF